MPQIRFVVVTVVFKNEIYFMCLSPKYKIEEHALDCLPINVKEKARESTRK